jgi:integrase
VDVTAKNLQAFRVWMLERGRTEGTADLYVGNIRTCAADKHGLTARLVGGRLAPNTLRANLASLRAWARFTDDGKLQARLSDLRLPPARRVSSKPPLDAEQWKRAVLHIQTCKMDEAMRQVLLMMALRGFRSGDVLRMRKAEIQRAIDTGKLDFEAKGRKRIEFSAKPFMAPLRALAAMPGWVRVRDLIADKPATAKIKVWRASVRVAKQVGLKGMNPHRYRHTFATNYLKQLAGDPNAIIKLQKFMAWESMATAARYVDSVSQNQLDAIGDELISDLLR